jgi:hypothetical protein
MSWNEASEHDQNRLLAQQALHWPQEGLECLLFLSLRPDIKRWGDVGRRQPVQIREQRNVLYWRVFPPAHRRSRPRVPSGRSSDKPRCPDGAASESSAGGSRFLRPPVLPMPRQCGTCGRPAASRRTQGLEAAEHAILRQHAPSALRVGKPFQRPGDRTARSSGTQS